MIVSELIELLKDMPQDLEVWNSGHYYCWGLEEPRIGHVENRGRWPLEVNKPRKTSKKVVLL